MITEDYVSFEIAKLLKEKGFDEHTEFCFVGEDWESPSPLTNSQLPDGRYSRPTLQMAMKWLREVHNIHISVYPFNRDLPITENTFYTCDIATENMSSQYGHLRGVWKTYEKAAEAAIKYCLENLI